MTTEPQRDRNQVSDRTGSFGWRSLAIMPNQPRRGGKVEDRKRERPWRRGPSLGNQIKHAVEGNGQRRRDRKPGEDAPRPGRNENQQHYSQGHVPCACVPCEDLSPGVDRYATDSHRGQDNLWREDTGQPRGPNQDNITTMSTSRATLTDPPFAWTTDFPEPVIEVVLVSRRTTPEPSSPIPVAMTNLLQSANRTG